MPWPQAYKGEPFLNLNFIYPLKQQTVRELIDHTRTKYPGVEAIAVFGSSVTPNCRVDSDVDIAIWKPEGYLFIEPDNDVYDVIDVMRIKRESALGQEIASKGVIVYVRDTV